MKKDSPAGRSGSGSRAKSNGRFRRGFVGIRENGRYNDKSISMIILLPFTAVAVMGMLFLGVTLYQQFANRTEDMTITSTRQLLTQTSVNLESYLRSMRRISDTMSYDVIKDKDLADDTVDNEMNVLYEANKDDLVSCALYSADGDLISATPVSIERANNNITKQEWFVSAQDQIENLHFSTPHVQNLFDDPTYRYYWVISLSRAVELTDNGRNSLGVLIVDMNYDTIRRMQENVNDVSSEQYVYLCDDTGRIIYHPRQMQIASGLYKENNLEDVKYEDGSHEERFDGRKRIVVVDTVSYTGWKLVSVIPVESFRMSMVSMKYLVIMLVSLALLIIIVMNRLISNRVAYPIIALNDSVKDMEAGDGNSRIYIGGSSEVRHLGNTLQQSFDRNRQLMKDVVQKQEEKRKAELDVLQSQINPHFLYNTLDSIVWMIEGERYKEAVFMITQLASLFRISLSKGRTIIPISDELKHAQNYMNIQKTRFKNSFTVSFDIDEEINDYSIVKLVVQPILENAVYYGVKDMDDEGRITVTGHKEENDIYIEVRDNGFGMIQDVADQLLVDDNRVHKQGSGVGLINVHRRIQLRYGQQYGLIIVTEPDEGMSVTIHIPAIKYSDGQQEVENDEK